MLFQFDTVGLVKKSWLPLYIRFPNCIKPSKEDSKHNSTFPASINDYNTKLEQKIHFNSNLRNGKLTPNNNSKTNMSYIEKE